MKIPLIKGPSDSGKTLLAVELVKYGMEKANNMKKKSLSTLISMNNHLYMIPRTFVESIPLG